LHGTSAPTLIQHTNGFEKSLKLNCTTSSRNEDAPFEQETIMLSPVLPCLKLAINYGMYDWHAIMA